LKELNWDVIVENLMASEKNEEEKEQTSSEKSKKFSQGGRKSLSIIIPTTNLTDKLNEVIFYFLQTKYLVWFSIFCNET
jgi:hypothetical protein